MLLPVLRRMLVMVLLCPLATVTGCGGSVSISAVDQSTVDAEARRLAAFDMAAATSGGIEGGERSGWRGRLTRRDAELVMQRLAVAVRAYCQPGGDGCAARLAFRRDAKPNASMDEKGILAVNTGLLSTLRTRDQLAFVMAHEMGHRLAAHREASSLRRSMGQAAGFLVGMGLVAAAATQADGMTTGATRDLGRAAEGLVDVGGRAGRRLYSQRQELEADHLGVRIMADAGFDPAGAVDAFGVMSTATLGRQDESGIFGSHPGYAERIAHLRADIPGLPERSVVIAAAPPADADAAADDDGSAPRRAAAAPDDSQGFIVWSDDLVPLD